MTILTKVYHFLFKSNFSPFFIFFLLYEHLYLFQSQIKLFYSFLIHQNFLSFCLLIINIQSLMHAQSSIKDQWTYFSEIYSSIIKLTKMDQIIVKSSSENLIQLLIFSNQSTLLLAAKYIDLNCQIYTNSQLQNLFLGQEMKKKILNFEQEFIHYYSFPEKVKINLTNKLTDKYQSQNQSAWQSEKNLNPYFCLQILRISQSRQEVVKQSIEQFLKFLKFLSSSSIFLSETLTKKCFGQKKKILQTKQNLKRKINKILNDQSVKNNQNNNFLIINQNQIIETQKSFSETSFSNLIQKSQNNDGKILPSGVFKTVSQIVEQEENPNSIIVEKKGGYFSIKKKICKITYYSESQIQNNIQFQVKELAVKRIKKTKKRNTIFNYEQKLKKEYQILSQLFILSVKELKYFATYYVPETSKNTQGEQNICQNFIIAEQAMLEAEPWDLDVSFSTAEDQTNMKKQETTYMDYYSQNLDEYLQTVRSSNSLFETIDLIKQAAISISCLHKCGIIHRDIKPQNFMINYQQKKIQLKLIDFGQSTHVNCVFNPNQKLTLGYTIPYAPIQCTTNCPQGFNKQQIDLWSFGVMVLEMVMKRIPVTYSKCFAGDISLGWPKDFTLFISRFNVKSTLVYERYLIMLACQMIKVKPQERLPLNKFIDSIMMLEAQMKDLI